MEWINLSHALFTFSLFFKGERSFKLLLLFIPVTQIQVSSGERQWIQYARLVNYGKFVNIKLRPLKYPCVII